MAVTTHPPDVRVHVASDASEARLIIPAGVDRLHLTLEHSLAQVEAAGVELTDELRRRVAQVIYRANQDQSLNAVEAVIAQSVSPRHGKAGWVQWYLDQEPEPESDDDDAGVCHYSRSAFTLVEAGEALACVHEPTAGEAGRDVTGQVLEAYDGEPAELELDDSVCLGHDGILTAQIGGVLVRQGDRVAIDPVLRVNTDVDFSTGNIAFDGDVIIKGGVRDRFLVHASGHVEVAGLIEAATLEVGGNLYAKGGFAGRERGKVHVGGDLHARYLHGICGEIRGDLVCEREIMNCRLFIHGRAQIERAAIIGGRVNVAGSVDVGLLGAPAGTLTELVVGCVPRLEPLAEELSRRLEQINRRRNELREWLHQVGSSAAGSKPSHPGHNAHDTEAELASLTRTYEKARHAFAHLRQAIESQRTIHVNIERRIAPGVVLIVGNRRFPLQQELVGPVEIRRNVEGQLIYRQGHGAARPLETLSQNDQFD